MFSRGELLQVLPSIDEFQWRQWGVPNAFRNSTFVFVEVYDEDRLIVECPDNGKRYYLPTKWVMRKKTNEVVLEVDHAPDL